LALADCIAAPYSSSKAIWLRATGCKGAMAVSRADTVVTTGATASLLITFHGFSPPLVPVSFVEAPSRSSAGFFSLHPFATT
jgi:hypothetical protein